MVFSSTSFTKAAEQGDSEAQKSLALCYEKGLGVEKNDKMLNIGMKNLGQNNINIE